MSNKSQWEVEDCNGWRNEVVTKEQDLGISLIAQKKEGYWLQMDLSN